jgi:hypothetical protein
MSVNPYAPPTSMVADVIPDEGRSIQPPFFAVSITKLIIMCLCSFTVYEVYWFYRNWKRVQERERASLSPILRAIFGPLFSYSLFSRMSDYSGDGDAGSLLDLNARQVETTPVRVGGGLAAGPLAIGVIASNVFFRLPNAFSLLGFLSVGCLVVAQVHVNRLNAIASPGHDPNSRITGWNWLLVIPGGLFFLLAVTGLLLATP